MPIKFYNFFSLKETFEKAFKVKVDPNAGKIKIDRKIYRLQERDISKVNFDEDGIFLEVKGVRYYGFLVLETNYRRAYPDRVLGRPSYLPKFHTTLCEKLEDMKSRGRFDGVYIFSEKEIQRADSEDGRTGELSDLRICGFCKNADERIDDYIFTKDFVENHLIQVEEKHGFSTYQLPKQYERDEWGYVNGWDAMSLAYRAKKQFICEKCGLDLSRNKYFLEVHHINANKADNREANLQCLCIGCHANVDRYHRDNYYNSPNNREKLKAFRQLYPSKSKQKAVV